MHPRDRDRPTLDVQVRTVARDQCPEGLIKVNHASLIVPLAQWPENRQPNPAADRDRNGDLRCGRSAHADASRRERLPSGASVSEMAPTLLDDLIDWLRIPSISTGGGDPAEIERAATWVIDRVCAAGGEGELVRIADHNPLAVGELRASNPGAPTILIYGHYDVQGPGAPELWHSPAFEPTIRDGRIFARGACDDKGNFLPLLHVACAMASAGELPVNVRILVEGEEEVGGGAVTTWIREDSRGADAAIVFDSMIPDPDTPAITVGLRGAVMLGLKVTTADHNLHSGLYGGSVLNALHAMHASLAAVLPGAGGLLRDELREGISPPAPGELASWERLPSGEELITQAGGHPAYPGAGGEYYLRNGADASLDINEIVGGEPRTIIPAQAHATVSLRLAPGQDAQRIHEVLIGLLRSALPAGAELEETSVQLAEPTLFSPEEPALQLAAEALRRACNAEPVFIRCGGTIPIVAEMAAQGYPVIVSGFALADNQMHAPNESYALRSLEWGEAASRELFKAFAALPVRV
jgi:acetylornithine deacetylase/succinyl-diaminopimelate desuccinylase-like protein